MAILAVSFAGIALLLSLIGMYGLMSYAVARRTRELVIRMALGAQRTVIVRSVVCESLLTMIGIAIGVSMCVCGGRGSPRHWYCRRLWPGSPGHAH